MQNYTWGQLVGVPVRHEEEMHESSAVHATLSL